MNGTNDIFNDAGSDTGIPKLGISTDPIQHTRGDHDAATALSPDFSASGGLSAKRSTKKRGAGKHGAATAVVQNRARVRECNQRFRDSGGEIFNLRLSPEAAQAYRMLMTIPEFKTSGKSEAISRMLIALVAICQSDGE